MAETKEEWMERMVEALGVDPEDILEVCEMFFDDADESIAALKDVFEKGDTEVFTRTAHSIKGAAANIGLESVSALAKELEMESKAGAVVDFEAQCQKLCEAIQESKAFVGL